MSDYSWVTDGVFDEKLEQIVAERYGERAMQLIRDHAPDAWSDLRESLNNEVLEALEAEREEEPDPFEVERRVDAVIPDWYDRPDRSSRFASTQKVKEKLREAVRDAVEAALDVAEEADPRVDWGVHVLGMSADQLLTETVGSVVDTSLTGADLDAWTIFVLENGPNGRSCPVAECSFACGLYSEGGFHQMMGGVYCHHATRLAQDVIAGLLEDGVLIREEDLSTSKKNADE